MQVRIICQLPWQLLSGWYEREAVNGHSMEMGMNPFVRHRWVLIIILLMTFNEGCGRQTRIDEDKSAVVTHEVTSIIPPAIGAREDNPLSSQSDDGQATIEDSRSVEQEISVFPNVKNIQVEKQEPLIEPMSAQNESLSKEIVLEHESFQEARPVVPDETNADFENLQSWVMNLPIPSSNKRTLAIEPEVSSDQNSESSQVNEEVNVLPGPASKADPESYKDEPLRLYRVNKQATRSIASDINEVSQVPFPGFEAIAIPVFPNEHELEEESGEPPVKALVIALDAESNVVSSAEMEPDELLETQKDVWLVPDDIQSTGLEDKPSQEMDLSLPAPVFLPPLPKVSLEKISEVSRGPERKETSFSDPGMTQEEKVVVPMKLQGASYFSVPKEASSSGEEGVGNSRESDVIPTRNRRIENDKSEKTPVIQPALVPEHAVNVQPSEAELGRSSQSLSAMIQELEEKPQHLVYQGTSRSINGLMVCQQGREQLARHQYQEAMVLFSESIQAFQAKKVRDDEVYELQDCYRQRAYVHLQLKAPKQALSDITHVLHGVQSGNSDRSQDVFFRGRLYAIMYDSQNAIDDLSLALELGLQTKDQAYAYYLRGLSHLRLQHIDPGLRDVSEGCRQNFPEACQLLEQIL